MHIYTIVLNVIVISTYLHEVQTECNSAVVEKIRGFWNKNPPTPTGLISKYSGSWTLTHLGIENVDNNAFKCFKQDVNAATSSSIDSVLFENSEVDFTTKFILHEKPDEAGVLYRQQLPYGHDSLKDNEDNFIDKYYVVYLDNNVAAWYVCTHGVTPFGIVSIRDFVENKDKPEIGTALEEAKKRMREATIPIPGKLPTSCPTECDSAVVEKIRGFWNKNPPIPTGLISKYSGSWTLTHLGMENVDNNAFKCFKQDVNAATSSSIDNVLFINSKDDFTTKFILHEKPDEAGVLYRQQLPVGQDSLKDNEKSEDNFIDKFYEVYLDNNVAAWYVCTHGVTPFGIVSIRDFVENKDKPDTKIALEEAKKRMGEATIPIPGTLPTDCPHTDGKH